MSIPHRPATPPAPDQLPCTVVQLGATGQIVGAWPADTPGLAPGAQFGTRLAAGSRTLWETVWWPLLVRQGAMQEILLELEGAGPDGRAAHVLTQWRRDHGPQGVVYTGVLTPGGERQRLLDELKAALSSLECMPGAAVQMAFDAHGLRVPYASGRLLDLLGVTARQATAEPARLLAALTPATAQGLLAAARAAQAGGRRRWTVPLVQTRRPARTLELSAVRPLGQDVWHGLVVDVTERERLTQELRMRASTDGLTRLMNRDALLARLHELHAAGLPYALVQLDCNRLRNINDSLGYEAGDELLRQLATRLSDLAGTLPAALEPAPAACHTARLQADEFALVLEGLFTPAPALLACDQAIATLARPYALRGMEVVCSVSLGVALGPGVGQPEDLLRDASTAMHASKAQGRNQRTLFEPHMQGRALAALGLEAELRKALDEGQLRVTFQPVMDMDSGRCVGAEALVRWRHPERGEIPPSEFIPIAEDSGLILRVGEVVLELACRHHAAWQRAGLPVPERISVNLSKAQLVQRDLELRVAAILQRHGLQAGQLTLEVTESMAMSDQGFVEVLSRLRALGIGLALDDFGTGHSSLASLQLLPVQQVKIDRSFVRDVVDSDYNRALIQASLQVAGALKLDVVAEGIEHAGQARVLQQLGCRKGQGWLWSPAMEPEAFAGFLARANGCAAPPAGPVQPAGLPGS